jgi:hypothetical protein
MVRPRAIPDTVSRLAAAGFLECPLDYFYDAQVSRRRHAARVALADVVLSLPAADQGQGPSFAAQGTLHVLLWSVGFMVFRLTFTDSGMRRPSTGFRAWFKLMHGLEHDFPSASPLNPSCTWSARIDGVPIEAKGGVRRFFDAAGAAMHEVIQGRKLSATALAAWAMTADTALDHAEDLVARGELRYPHPVTFGTHSELVWRSPRSLPGAPDAWIPELIGSGAEGELIATDVDAPLDGKWWFMSEFQSVVVGASEPAPRGGEVMDAIRAEMIEYIAFRRTGLMAIQRETASVTAERRAVQGARVADWMWLMSALTNDYVLGGWSGTMFARVRSKFVSFDGMRNLFDLEAQVRNTIDTFQGRLDAESERVGVVTGVLFGIVAATALVPLGELFVIGVFGLGGNAYANFPGQYPGAFAAVIVGMLAVVGAVSWRLLRHANSLRPPSADRSARLPRRWRRRTPQRRPRSASSR